MSIALIQPLPAASLATVRPDFAIVCVFSLLGLTLPDLR
jgi:hypothetical protein